MAKKITTAQHLALRSVQSGRCYRRFSSAGNTLHSKDGCRAAVLWRLEALRLIREDRHLTPTVTTLALTDDGAAARGGIVTCTERLQYFTCAAAALGVAWLVGIGVFL